MLPHNLTDDELLNIDSQDALVKELQNRLSIELDRKFDIQDYVASRVITKSYIDKNDKEHTIDSAIYWVKSELERIADESPEMFNKLEKALKYTDIVDTCNMQNDEDIRQYTDGLENLL